jgi:hypothetical protein
MWALHGPSIFRDSRVDDGKGDDKFDTGPTLTEWNGE